MCYAIRLSLLSGQIDIFIYNRMDEEQVDEWTSEKVEVQGSLFDKTTITFTNDVIEQNIDKLMEEPILNLPIEQYEENEGDEELKQMTKDCRDATKESEKQQALFNPVQDEQNEKWVKKHGKRSLKPLICPSCFNQITYDYEIQSSDENSKSYSCRHVFGCEVKQNKIIREKNLSQTMNWEGASSSSAEQQLRLREEAINVKILTQCNCGYSVGYFDINKECFVLLNVL